MKVISIVDDDYGIMFNNRRVSKDSVLNEHIIKMLDGGKLWLSLYSKQLFGDYENIEVNQEFGFAGKDDFCLLRTLRLFLMRIWWMRFICISGTGSILLM